MEIHGVKNDLSTEAQFIVDGDAIKGITTFDIAVEDYDIEIPKLVKDKVAKIVKIMAEFDFEPSINRAYENSFTPPAPLSFIRLSDRPGRRGPVGAR